MNYEFWLLFYNPYKQPSKIVTTHFTQRSSSILMFKNHYHGRIDRICPLRM